MSDKPINFNGPMVRALLREIEAPGTGKTQTRRPLKPQPDRHLAPTFVKAGAYAWWEFKDRDRSLAAPDTVRATVIPGDRLWVREKFAVVDDNRDFGMQERGTDAERVCHFVQDEYDCDHLDVRWRPSIHMPRWASRITLIVTDVRVQRLQDISEADALAEGVPDDEYYVGSFEKEHCRTCGGSGVHGAFGGGYGVTEVDCSDCATAKLRFRNLWNSIYGVTDKAWKYNPWVAAYTFRPVLYNIDQMPAEAAE